MAEVIGANWITLEDLMARVRVKVRDNAANVNPKWSNDEVRQAISEALASSGNEFHTEHLYEDLEFAAGTLSYSIPQYIQRIVKVERQRTIPYYAGSSSPDYAEILQWDQVRNPGQNTLVLFNEYPAGATRIWYTTDVIIPIVDVSLSVAVDADDTTFTVGIPVGYSLYNMPIPCFLQADNGEVIKATGITFPETLEVERAQFNTTADTIAANATLSPVLAENDDRLFAYVINYAAYVLNMMIIQDANRGSDVAGNLTAAREQKADAEKLLRRRAVRPRTRKIKPERRRRGGRL